MVKRDSFAAYNVKKNKKKTHNNFKTSRTHITIFILTFLKSTSKYGKTFNFFEKQKLFWSNIVVQVISIHSLERFFLQISHTQKLPILQKFQIEDIITHLHHVAVILYTVQLPA